MAKKKEDDFLEALEGLEVEDISINLNKKKRVNSKKKGNRVELELTKLLTTHFGRDFSRSVGSGNRWGQVANLPSHAKMTLTGDICSPEGFLWVIECKGGYEDQIDLNNALDGGCAKLDDFIQQSTHDNAQSGRKPIIIWKRSRKPWLAMLLKDDLGELKDKFEYLLKYRDWVMVPFEKLLKETVIDYWFAKEGSDEK